MPKSVPVDLVARLLEMAAQVSRGRPLASYDAIDLKAAAERIREADAAKGRSPDVAGEAER